MFSNVSVWTFPPLYHKENEGKHSYFGEYNKTQPSNMNLSSRAIQLSTAAIQPSM